MGDAPHYKRAIRFIWRLLRKIMHFVWNRPFFRIPRHCELAINKFNLTSAITTPTTAYPITVYPTTAYLTYVLLFDVNNWLSSSLACEAADFWLFLIVVLVFLVAFCCICAMRAWWFFTTFRDSITFCFCVVFRIPTTPVVWGLVAFWATGGDR